MCDKTLVRGHRARLYCYIEIMDSFYQILFLLADPEVRQWAHEIVDMVGSQGGDEYADPEEVHEAIDNPMLFIGEIEEDDDRLHATFKHYLSLVELEKGKISEAISRRLLLRKQPFERPLKIFDEHSVGALKLSIDGKARRFHVSSPSDEDLGFLFPDIARGASLVRGYIDALRDVAIGREMRDYLKDVDEELAGVVENAEAYDQQDVRRRIWEVQWMAAGAKALLELPEQVFLRQSQEIADGLEAYMRDVPADAMHVASSLIKLIRAGIEGDATDGRFRDVVVEAHIVLADFLFGDEHRVRGGEEILVQPRFEDISSYAFALIEIGEPERAIAEVRKITRDSMLAGAALLDASYRYRLRHSTSTLLRDLSPILKRTQLIRVSESPVEGAAGEAKRVADDLGDLDFLKSFPRYLEGGTPIHLEFGGGWSPVSREMAWGRDDHRFISIDPNPEPVKNKFHYMGEFAENFVPLVGRAEDIAPFAALGSFAEGVYMISPPAASLNSMILSALLAVKPGRFVNIYLNAEQDSDYGWIAEAGFDKVEIVLDRDDPTLPESECFKRYSGVKHLRIRVTDLEVGGDDSPKGRGKGFNGIVREGDGSKGDVEASAGPDISDAETVSDIAAQRQSTDAVMCTALVAGFGVLKYA
jgi:hypothetical protein